MELNKADSVKEKYMNEEQKVFIVYTGGTIGMLPKEAGNPSSPLVAKSWEELKDFAPTLYDLPIEVKVHEMDLIDSSDMHPEYWVDIAKVIRDNYNDYDGFLVMHGTDTMTYTATGLSFLLENLDKPVIVTGSQIAIAQARNDAMQNLVTALMLAAPKTFDLPLVPEVTILFGGKLLRGNRSRKVSSSGFDGFSTPNYDSLAEVGEHIKVNEKFVRPPSQDGFFIHESLEQNVMMFDIFPGIKPSMLRRIFDMDDLKGVVFRTYGAGNAPTGKEFLAEIKRAIDKGVTVLNVTQCQQGMVEMGLYDASATLQHIGVISGVDMTPEAALVKMMFLLGQGYEGDVLREQMQQDQRGEQSVNVYTLDFGEGATDDVYKASAKTLSAGFNKAGIVKVNVSLDSVTLPKGKVDAVLDLALYLNYPSANTDTETDIPQCLDHVEQNYEEGSEQNIILDCTDSFKQVIDPTRPMQLTLVSRNGLLVQWAGFTLSAYTSV